MNKEKQILEMKSIIDKAEEEYSVIWNEWFYDHEEGTKIDNEFLFFAKILYDAGYRKASEIFEEIEKKIKNSLVIHLEEINKEYVKDTPLYDRHSGIIFALQGMDDFIAELKNKYTEGEE